MRHFAGVGWCVFGDVGRSRVKCQKGAILFVARRRPVDLDPDLTSDGSSRTSLVCCVRRVGELYRMPKRWLVSTVATGTVAVAGTFATACGMPSAAYFVSVTAWAFIRSRSVLTCCSPSTRPASLSTRAARVGRRPEQCCWPTACRWIAHEIRRDRRRHLIHQRQKIRIG
jgi:hypothetical protein